MKVETLGVPLLGKADIPKTRLTNWTENSNDDKEYAFVIRIFQLIGPKSSKKKSKRKRRLQLGAFSFESKQSISCLLHVL